MFTQGKVSQEFLTLKVFREMRFNIQTLYAFRLSLLSQVKGEQKGVRPDDRAFRPTDRAVVLSAFDDEHLIVKRRLQNRLCGGLDA